MTRISRDKQIIFYFAVLLFGISFFFYFYKQASITESDFQEVTVSGNRAPASVNRESAKIDVTFFDSEKFKNLRSDAAPAQSFQTGKRNPFEPY